MICQYATKAEAMFAVTGHCWNHLIEVLLLNPAFNGIGTVWTRAPFQKLFIFDIGFGEEFVISVVKIYRDEQI
jgi:hypothetical protein